jgi:phage I-like protein
MARWKSHPPTSRSSSGTSKTTFAITAGHDNGGNGGELSAIGWFKELIDRGVSGLYAVVEWTGEGKQLLSDRAFKYFSPEFYEE